MRPAVNTCPPLLELPLDDKRRLFSSEFCLRQHGNRKEWLAQNQLALSGSLKYLMRGDDRFVPFPKQFQGWCSFC